MAPSRKSVPRTGFEVKKRSFSSASRNGRLATYLKDTYDGDMNLAVMNLLSIVCMPAVLASEGASQEEIEQEQRRSRDRFEAHMIDSLNGAIEWGDGQDEGDRSEEEDVFGVMEDDD